MLYDKDIREPLFDYLEERYKKIRIIEEKNMGQSRADIVMVLEDAVVGIEIKSDADTYARLERQVKDYDTYFDYNMVVVGSTHGQHIADHVPEWWGIITVEEPAEREEEDGQASEIDFYQLRAMTSNPKVDPLKKLSILWRPELVHIQELNDMPAYKQKSKLFVVKKIWEKVPKDILKQQISDELFERDYRLIADQINAFRVAQNRKPRRKKRRRRKRV